jgi:DNA-binding FrmR family transcriptional regulator
MELRLSGTPAEVWECLHPVLILADWTAEPVAGSDGLYAMHALDLEPPAAQAWMRLEADGDGTLVTVWLPDEVEASDRDKLRTALESLVAAPSPTEEALLNRLRRIEGQIRGLQRMVETRRDCEAIMTQFAAVSSALKQSAALLLSEHLITCLRNELAEGRDATHINQRLLNILF